MPTLWSCAGVPLETIHRCVQAAFADYLVPMELSLSQLQYILAQRGFDPAMSLLARQGDEAVSFCLVGTNDDGRPGQAYVITAGTVPAYRQCGISSEIFRSISGILVASDKSSLWLEVIHGNRAALGLYEKLGFRRQRELNCFTLDTPLAGADGPRGFELRRFDPHAVIEQLESFQAWRPSWQNEFTALSRVAERTIALGAFDQRRCLGYGILVEPIRVIAQLAVRGESRRRGVGSAILRALSTSVPSGDPLWVGHLDSRDEASQKFFVAHGARPDTAQAEMVLALA